MFGIPFRVPPYPIGSRSSRRLRITADTGWSDTPLQREVALATERARARTPPNARGGRRRRLGRATAAFRVEVAGEHTQSGVDGVCLTLLRCLAARCAYLRDLRAPERRSGCRERVAPYAAARAWRTRRGSRRRDVSHLRRHGSRSFGMLHHRLKPCQHRLHARRRVVIVRSGWRCGAVIGGGRGSRIGSCLSLLGWL